MTEETFESTADIKIFFRTWQPSGKKRGLAIIVHGFNAHSGYYGWVAGQLTGMNLAVYALDLRGRGKSDGERFYVEKFADYVDDVGRFVTLARSREPGLPVFLLAHSAGGVISALYTVDNQSQLAGFICEDFAFQVPTPDFALATLKGLSHLAPHAHVVRLKNELFSRDPKVVELMNSDPLIAHETQPTKTMAELVRADERLKREFPRFKLPLLIIHGAADKVTKPSGSQFFYDHAGSSDKTLKLYPGSYHDPLNDLDKEVVMGDIKGWIGERLPRD